jgi:hypothetical protein
MKDDDQERIKAYIAAKMAHIKMYNECMNLADGLDVEKFAELVRQDERIAVLETIEELKGMESDRHPMFSEGYDHGYLGSVSVSYLRLVLTS